MTSSQHSDFAKTAGERILTLLDSGYSFVWETNKRKQA